MARTRQKDRDVPAPRSPWDEVIQHLWMGGHYWTDERGEFQAAVPEAEFGLVVSLYARSGHGPSPGVPHLIHEIPDGPLGPHQIDQVLDAAHATAEAVRAGRPTLVRCFSGYNRSGLVTAQALIELGGLDPYEAIALIRRRRSPWALHNETFVEYLDTGLSVARLLTDLDSPI
ncbi:protein phosphatase [Streptomyces sp. NPDC001941]|uniref:protein-tyrosine phosphatase family protein n=1 Tax=Streptomyces sp. NPDC001941 TaxID=3154659 RepID=UPI003332F230